MIRKIKTNFTDKILVLSGMKICVILYLFGGNMCIYERVSSIYKCFYLMDEFFCCENLGCCYSAMPFCYDTTIWVRHIYSCKFFNIIEILLNFFCTIELNFRKISNFHHNRKSLEKSIHSAIFISRPDNTIWGINPLKPIL